MNWACCNHIGAAEFYDLSLVRHGDSGGEIPHHRHGVRDEEVSESEIALELSEEIHDLRADAHVEGGYGLVTNDEFGTECEGASDADALALSAGELVRVAGACGFVEADCAEEFGNARSKAPSF